MATKSLLVEDERAIAEQLLRAPVIAPDGDLEAPIRFPARDFSAWLARRLEDRLRAWPEWEAAQPIALGSWARGELAPASDLDLLFVGDPEATGPLVRRLQESGVKVRARVPEDMSDWSRGVEPFDVLALLRARPFFKPAAERLREQQGLVRSRGGTGARALLSAMSKERVAREKRFDSISSFLEPNLKYGHGGLRDLEQALTVSRLFPDRFPRNLHALRVMGYYKDFFLTARHKLHLSDVPGEVLAATEQEALARWFGFDGALSFMRQIERGLARVSFYADWVFAQATSDPRRLRAVDKKRLKKPVELFRALEADPSILMQARVRSRLEPVFGPVLAGDLAERTWTAIGSELRSIVAPWRPEASAVALFRSRLIDRAIPEFSRIVGHVQHDQYHRFSVDAHLLQAVREAKRAWRTPKRSGRLASVLRRLSQKDWEALGWAAIFHDLAKGREGHHSIVGIELAERNLKRFGVADSVRADVVWLVERHLDLSQAAFRKNPRAPETWRALGEVGAVDRRLDLLAAFTYIDIRATNPEAWTPWKERLLSDLVDAVRSPQAGATVAFFAAAKARGVDPESPLLQGLDPSLTELLPRKALLEDLIRVAGSLGNEEPLVVRANKNESWVRLHAREDRQGLFLEFVERLRSSGLSVRHASVRTSAALGAYDWFLVRSSKPALALSRILAAQSKTQWVSEAPRSGVKGALFDSVELVSQDPAEWIFSFRGKDRPGALIEAARALFAAGLVVRWARVHTWGRQIDDVFGVEPVASVGVEEVETRLRRALVQPKRQ